jgi:hypothetical protein
MSSIEGDKWCFGQILEYDGIDGGFATYPEDEQLSIGEPLETRPRRE